MKKLDLRYINPLYRLYKIYMSNNDDELHERLNPSGVFITVELDLYYTSISK